MVQIKQKKTETRRMWNEISAAPLRVRAALKDVAARTCLPKTAHGPRQNPLVSPTQSANAIISDYQTLDISLPFLSCRPVHKEGSPEPSWKQDRCSTRHPAVGKGAASRSGDED